LEALAESHGGWPGYVQAMIRSTALRDITEHALFYREPSDCHVYGRGRVTLLGDAAHLTAAALGQVRLRKKYLHVLDGTAYIALTFAYWPISVVLGCLNRGSGVRELHMQGVIESAKPM
jgi:hypothetical protein